MLQVTRKDDKESLENMIRRFNKKVQQSGVLGIARRGKYFEKPLSKRAQREIAIRKSARKAAKARAYLPAAMSEDELRMIVDEVCSAQGATEMKQMGSVVGAVMKQVGARADGGTVARLVREKLGA
jgi:ribosomal protein S21